MVSGDLNISWDEYVRLVSQQDGRAAPGWTIRVFDHEEGSYLGEVAACQDAFRRYVHFAAMPLTTRKLVAGWDGGRVEYLGSMRAAAAFKQIVKHTPQHLSDVLDRLPGDGPLTLDDVQDVLGEALAIRGVGMASASRLLTVRRPDLLLPVTKTSRAGIQRIFGTSPSTAREYAELVGHIWSFRWCAAPSPALDLDDERRMWHCRVALLDAIFC